MINLRFVPRRPASVPDPAGVRLTGSGPCLSPRPASMTSFRARFMVTIPEQADASIAIAFQSRETEDLQATVLGHSVLTKAKELLSIHNYLVSLGQSGSAQDISSHLGGVRIRF